MNTNEIFANQLDSVYEIQISRGEKMNALTDAMYGSLVSHLNYAENSNDIKVIIIRSDNKHFSAGNDLADFLETEFNNESNVIQFLRAMATLKKPVIAAVGGAAVGIGVTMLLHCDWVVACDDTKFSVPFIKLGLTPEGGSSRLLAQRCGTARAHDWLLTGRTFLADEALSCGLVNKTSASIESTWGDAQILAKGLTKSSLRALTDTKALLKADEIDSVLVLMEKEAKVFASALKTTECQNAFNAFLNK
ncbi:MAG: enoyl-CoA hydratase [Gammaproteobacteria bacterium]|nr:MAG: enoyl-CoA hydratase [Gammaproteobacteria bacterium]